MWIFAVVGEDYSPTLANVVVCKEDEKLFVEELKRKGIYYNEMNNGQTVAISEVKATKEKSRAEEQIAATNALRSRLHAFDFKD